MALRKLFAGVASSLLLALVVAAPVAAADPGDILIAQSTAGRALKLGDVAADNAIAVVWQQGTQSYVRWSTDGGSSFTARHALRSGLRAKSPRVAVCGDMIWAVSTWKSDDNMNVGVDWIDTAHGQQGRFALGPGFESDIACMDGAVAVTWQAGHGMLAVFSDQCTSSCTPDFAADFGSMESGGYGPAIAATADGFVVAYISATITLGLTVQRFGILDEPGGLTVTPGSPLTMMAGEVIAFPFIGADGSRVVVAYRKDGQAHMRISDNSGATFGPRIVVSAHCPGCGSSPDSIDVSGGRIAVGVIKAGGNPPAVWERGFVTKNEGQSWSKTPGHSGGYQIGALTASSLAEVWDSHYYAASIYGHVPQEIWFHLTPLN